jgi:probable rRNA maturation factor
MIEIMIENEQEDIEIDDIIQNIIANVINKAIEVENITNDGEVSVLLVCEETIKAINNEHRNKNEITDVLSFPQYDNLEQIKKQEYIVLGDIVICVKRAQEQSVEYSHSFEREIGFLTAHSMYHLFGYDHMDETEEKLMEEKQEAILSLLELKR